MAIDSPEKAQAWIDERMRQEALQHLRSIQMHAIRGFSRGTWMLNGPAQLPNEVVDMFEKAKAKKGGA